jgi:hypothetical protein
LLNLNRILFVSNFPKRLTSFPLFSFYWRAEEAAKEHIINVGRKLEDMFTSSRRVWWGTRPHTTYTFSRTKGATADRGQRCNTTLDINSKLLKQEGFIFFLKEKGDIRDDILTAVANKKHQDSRCNNVNF